MSSDRPYYPALDGMRGVAILLVVFYHNFGFVNYFFFGWLGVDLFFVLSGFLITDILLRTKTQPHFLKRFYIRRIFRIFPLYYLILVTFFIVIPLFNIQIKGLDYFLQNQAWLWLYLQNWLYIFKPPGDSLLLTHLWSLAVEEQFYVAWPFIVLLIKNTKKLFWFMCGLLAFVIFFRYFIWIYQIERLAYFNLYTFSRIDGICIGSMLALFRSFSYYTLRKYTLLIVLLFAAFNFLFYFFNRQSEYGLPFLAIIGYTTFAVLFGLLVNEGIESSKFIDAVFNNRILKFFGDISYGLYIFHWPVHLLLFPFSIKWITIYFTQTVSLAQFLSSLLTSLIAILISYLSYRYYENFFLNLKKTPNQKIA